MYDKVSDTTEVQDIDTCWKPCSHNCLIYHLQHMRDVHTLCFNPLLQCHKANELLLFSSSFCENYSKATQQRLSYTSISTPMQQTHTAGYIYICYHRQCLTIDVCDVMGTGTRSCHFLPSPSTLSRNWKQFWYLWTTNIAEPTTKENKGNHTMWQSCL